MTTEGHIMNEQELREIYEWVDTFDLSRMKKNISRDFSDGVLIAEILHTYHPKLVDLHNYSAVNSNEEKIRSWQLLRKRVLKKLKFKLTDDEIYSLVRCERGMIEILLLKLKRSLEEQAALDDEELSDENQEVKEQRTKSQVQNLLSKLRVDESFEQVFNEQSEKARIQRSLLKTIELLQKKIDKQKILLKVREDKIKLLQKKINENKDN